MVFDYRHQRATFGYLSQSSVFAGPRHHRYLYAHDYEGGYVPQAYLPEGRIYYHPGENGLEKRIKERMDYLRALNESKPG